MKRVSDLIYMSRHSKRMSLDKLAAMVGKSTSMLSAIERDKKNGSIKLLKKISDILEIQNDKMFKAIVDDTKDDIAKLWESLK